jgi:peptidoglycan/xylan/chitin deacetylase (PgdA/CDA1 family)
MIVKSPRILKNIFPSLIWDVKTTEKEIFLTFDDGPHPTITPWVLDTLSKYNALATFFCVGENVCNFKNTFEKIQHNGHSIGNHSYNHIKGWNTNDQQYTENVSKARELINSRLFRPPYGRIKPSQIKKLKNEYSIIMWTVLSYDFDNNIDEQKCFRNSISSEKEDTIVVFHDSKKAEKNLKAALPQFLEYFSKLGFKFSALPMQSQINQ